MATSIAVTLVLVTTRVVGQDALPAERAPAAAASNDERHPPRPQHPIQPEYPPEARAAGAEGVAITLLVIDAEGAVGECVIDTSAGRQDLDDAACEALLGARFVPARRGETPIPSRIRFAVRFALGAEPAGAASEPGPASEPGAPDPSREEATGEVHGSIQARSREGSDDARAEPAYLALTDVRGSEQRVEPSADGAFAFEGVAPGAARVEVFGADGTLLRRADVVVVAGEIAELAITIDAGDEGIGVTAVVEAPRAQTLRRSAEAVQVVELETASQQSADLGEVLARQEGIGVRRSGGLGSNVRFSLNGLTDDQIRFFLDGVPIEWMGFPFGIADVPVNLIEHVEVYRGVVPIRFGADALGGAVNLRSRDPARSPNLLFSYQGGSFGTHRLTVDGGHYFTESGFYIRGRAFIDHADNDYSIRVDVADSSGRSYEDTVRRNHDGYDAQGGTIELGFANVPFADHLSIRAFITDYTRDVQHNVTMDVPYGEVQYGELSSGAVARYEDAWDQGRLSAILAYNYTRSWFTDVSECTYDWYGRCIAELGAGEIGRQPANQRRRTHAGLLRITGEIRPIDLLTVRLSVAPSLSMRTGEELADGDNALHPSDLPGDFFGLVGGGELELNVWENRVQAVVFAKYYLQALWSQEIVAPRMTAPIHSLFQQPGLGAAFRLLITDKVYVKASYEWATRLLRANEVFGNGALVFPNLDLQPEVSHNANAGLRVEGVETDVGELRGDLNLFLRLPDQLVVLLGQGDFFQYLNVSQAQSIGFEVAAGWTSPGDYVSIGGNVTYQDFRNTSSEGIFGAYQGDRIPNRPFLFTNATASLQFDRVLFADDRLTLSYYFRYVHEFFRNWESVGASRPDIKHTIESQLLHTAAVTYAIRHQRRRLTFSLELHNIGDAPAFDSFGIQRPGRAVYFKITGEL